METSLKKPPKRRRKRAILIIVLMMALVLTSIGWYHTNKQLPEGLTYESVWHPATDVEFLYNLSYPAQEEQVFEDQIYESWYETIAAAEEWIVLDMFLYNGYVNEEGEFPSLSRDLTDRILEQMDRHPELKVVVISDEINSTYGSHEAEELERLSARGAQIVISDTDALRDSNPIYSSFWRAGIQWFGQSGNGWLPNALADTAPKVTARSYLKLLNVKANHRKVLLTENTGIVTSANAHDASYYNSNIAIRFSGDVLADVLEAELAVIRYSGEPEPQLSLPSEPQPTQTSNGAAAQPPEGETSLRWLTEGAILQRTLDMIDEAASGEQLWMGMFYLADREIIQAVLDAAERGVDVRLILDPNENAFGQQKIGLPNRPVAAELLSRSEEAIQLRWYNTVEEQFHSKLLLVVGQEHSELIAGSANFTRRNLDDLNLEANIQVHAPTEAPIMQSTLDYFERLWTNQDAEFTLPYSAYADELPWIKQTMYGIQKLLRFTTY